MLSVIFSLEIGIEEKRKILMKEYGIEMDGKMEQEVISVWNYAEAMWTNGVEEGMEKGKLLGKLEALKNILESPDMTLENAMNLLKIAEEDRPMYRARLNL